MNCVKTRNNGERASRYVRPLLQSSTTRGQWKSDKMNVIDMMVLWLFTVVATVFCFRLMQRTYWAWREATDPDYDRMGRDWVEMSLLHPKNKHLAHIAKERVYNYPLFSEMSPSHIEHCVAVETQLLEPSKCCEAQIDIKRYHGGSPQVATCQSCNQEVFDDIGC